MSFEAQNKKVSESTSKKQNSGAQTIIERTREEYKRLAGIPASNLEVVRHPYATTPELTGINTAYYLPFFR